jgi:hypothetical protein
MADPDLGWQIQVRQYAAQNFPHRPSPNSRNKKKSGLVESGKRLLCNILLSAAAATLERQFGVACGF